uniref:Uncharacterized protein n=1 Tax=Lactuca sativa TaxID=4236 RepID=A0A9R1WYI1_LACSA|nr:hypothetical protein LSAT_V11C800389050 [Lactuca sativa]
MNEKLAFPLEEISPKNTEFVHEIVDLQTISAKSIDSKSDSIEIIEYSHLLGPYKSIVERVITEEVVEIAKEDQQFERKRKRVLALTQWKWDEVVDLCSDDDEKEDVIQPKKKARVCIHNRNRTMKLLNESDVEA